MSKVSAILLALALALSCHAGAQQTLDPAATSGLNELAAQANVIFAGQVLTVVHRSAPGSIDDAGGLVEVTFRVDAGLRGTRDGETYVLREWAGLWAGRAPRYRAGERLLMLLAAPRDSRGLAAPVGGSDGAIPLHATLAPPLRGHDGLVPRDETADTSETPAARKARMLTDLEPDLRWVRARALRGAEKTAASPAGLGVVLDLLTRQAGAADGAR